MIDTLVIVFILVSIFVGLLRGVLLTALSVVAVLIAWPAGAACAAPMGTLAGAFVPMEPSAALVVGRALGTLLVLASLMVSTRMIDRRIGHTSRGELETWNSALGGLAGLIVGGALAFLVLCGVDAWAKMKPESGVAAAAGKSWTRGLVTNHNPADEFLIVDAIEFLRIAAENPEAVDRLREDPAFRQLVEAKPIQDLIHDETLRRQFAEAAEKRDVGRLLDLAGHPRIRAVLQSKDLRTKLLSPELREAVAKIRRDLAEEAGEGEPSAAEEPTAPNPPPAQPPGRRPQPRRRPRRR